jgi:hypothetical protein
MEAALGANAVVNAILTVTTDAHGAPLAPFLNTSLSWLALNENVWVFLLSLYALLTLVSLAHGLATGNAYQIRSIVQVAGTMFQALVATAIFTSPLAPAAGLRYAMTAFWSFIIAAVLIIKHDVRAKADSAKADAKKGKCGVS